MKRTLTNFLDLGITVAGFVATRLFALVISLFIARSMGVNDFGGYSLFIAIFMLTSEASVAYDTTFIRNSNTEDKQNHTSLLLVNLISKVTYLMVIGSFGWFLAPSIATHILNKADSVELIRYSLICGGMLGIFNTLISNQQKKLALANVSLLRPISNFLVLASLLCVFAIQEHLEIRHVIISYVIAVSILAFTSIIYLIKKTHINKEAIFSNFIKFQRTGTVLLASSLVGLLANRLDIFILTANAEFSLVGEYGAAVRVSVVASLLTAAITTILVPNAPSVFTSSEGKKRYIGIMTAFSVFQTIAITFFIIFIEPLIDLLFGEAYINIKYIAIILMIQVLFETYGRGFQALIQCGPKPSNQFKFAVLRLFISSSLLFILVPSYGAIGAAISTATTSAIISIGMALVTAKHLLPTGKHHD